MCIKLRMGSGSIGLEGNSSAGVQRSCTVLPLLKNVTEMAVFFGHCHGPECRPAPEAADVFRGMSQQPESTTSSLAMSPAPLPGSTAGPIPVSSPVATGGPQTPQRIPRWLVRLELFLRVMLRMYIGLAVCYAPWSHMFWDQNPMFAQFPTLSIYAANGAVRGLISGLGLLNLWIAIQDAVRSRNR